MEDFIPKELAVKLKEKGFPQRPNYFNYGSYYNWDGLRKTHSLSNASVWFDPIISRDNIYFAPTISQVLKWLREEKGMYIQITLFEYCYDYCILDTKMVYYDNEHKVLHQGPTGYSYDEAALAGIEYCLDNLI
jgi:hypothetical protein